MKKNYVRLFAVLMCAVMLFSLVPAKANAVALDGRQMMQMKDISYDENWGGHFITETADLVHIAGIAANDLENYYQVIFDSDKVFTITQNVTIPNNMGFSSWNALTIPAGVTVELNGHISTSNLTVNGNLNIKQYGHISAGETLKNNGVINLEGTVGLNEYTAVSGGGQLNFIGNGKMQMSRFFSNSAELQEIVDAANTAGKNWAYNAVVDSEEVYLSKPVVLPENVFLQIYGEDFKLSGADITVNGNYVFDAVGACTVENNLILNGSGDISCYVNEGEGPHSVTFKGTVTNNGYMYVAGNVIVKNTFKNLKEIDLWIENTGSMTFAQPDLYVDMEGNAVGEIYVFYSGTEFPSGSIVGLNMDGFQNTDSYHGAWNGWWSFSGYNHSAAAHTHSVVVDAAVAPTCLTTGLTEGSHCATCDEVLVKQEVLAALGHDYGLAADGKTPDFWDTSCDVCGAERLVDKFRPTHSMYRMYNPNTGEHFYTGDKTERQMLEAAGWKYEGVGFTFPASTGKPVYRLFQPSTGEHLYTMDEVEKEALLANGWNFEGIAFNSGNENEVPQYRLYNPNVTVGAYHFTASIEERNVLLAAGWQDQGIGFYTCWQ